MIQPINKQYKDADQELWEKYRRTRTQVDRAALLKRFDPLIQRQVSKWAGPVSRDVLLSEGRLLAAKAFDSYDPTKGSALATHITNHLAPLSRLVYTYQNTARLPENLAIKAGSYYTAKDHMTSMLGREPTTDELHQELGWDSRELHRMENYMRKDLVESAGNVTGDFYGSNDDSDEDLLTAVYFSLAPDEKELFEYITGYGGKEKLSNPEIMKKLGLTQAQLSYKKTLLTGRIDQMTRSHRGSR